MEKLKFNKSGLALSRRIASEGSVLLKNDGVLPLKKNTRIALFGRNQCDTYKGGGGAADLWAVKCQPYCDGLEKLGNVYKPLLKKYRDTSKANFDPSLGKFHHAFNHHKYSLPEVRLTDSEVEAAAKKCDTAIIFIGRFAIEGRDIGDRAGEYRLTGPEEQMMCQVLKYFKNTVLVLNIPSALDLNFLDVFNFSAIIHNFYPGHLAGFAIADILYGRVAPCGRLPFSWAKRAEEYPTNEGLSTDKIVYREGLYMGYRYFDTFQKDVLFPFGYGLSYTDFATETISCEIEKTVATLKIKVTNCGKYRGREVVQCYLSAPEGKLQQPYQILCGFEKTRWLNPCESQILTIKIDLLKFTSFNEADAAYILEKGDYIIRVGKNSRDTKPVCKIVVKDTFTHKKVLNRLTPVESFDELKKPETQQELFDDILCLEADFSALETLDLTNPPVREELKKAGDFTFADVLSGKCTAEQLAACLTDEQLSLLLTGDGFDKQKTLGLSFQPLVEGEGTHTHQVTELQIPSSVMQDGPNGVRATTFVSPPVPPDYELSGRDCVYFPCTTAQAATWDRELLELLGRDIAVDLDKIGYNGLCAPGVNLHRNVRCGRNFEYFSEDPYLSAQMAAKLIDGVQKHADGTASKRYAVLKHFACNNSEDMRTEGDSILTERTARELYLRSFEYVLQETNPLSIMVAYNKINGTFASANHDLLDGICRYEWGYDGWIMTDWDVHAKEGACLSAGCDTCMPGHYKTFKELCDKGLTKADAQYRAANII
ncbi:MAG: glycoside hydrolase family 3 C-terminal domain-containing protein, partial [Clostridia bacterium]|nr:glycoside hydrolase family 3 C-terminal domain-containing protein [Clostridia bacterium]